MLKELNDMGDFPSFTQNGARGRSLLGFDEDTVWVEGKADAVFYSRIMKGRRFSVGEGKEEVILIGSEFPYPDCIVDSDFDSFIESLSIQRKNIFSTKSLNDLESIWIHALSHVDFLEIKFGTEPVATAYEKASLVGKLRIIVHRKSNSGKNMPWRMIFKGYIELNKLLQSRRDAWGSPLDYLLYHNSHKLKKKDQWLRKIRVLDKELPAEKLHFIRGKDMMLYLYLELDRKHSPHDFFKFNRFLMREAIKIIRDQPEILDNLEVYDLLSD